MRIQNCSWKNYRILNEQITQYVTQHLLKKRNTGLPVEGFPNVYRELQNVNQMNVFLPHKIHQLWNFCRKCSISIWKRIARTGKMP